MNLMSDYSAESGGITGKFLISGTFPALYKICVTPTGSPDWTVIDVLDYGLGMRPTSRDPEIARAWLLEAVSFAAICGIQGSPYQKNFGK